MDKIVENNNLEEENIVEPFADDDEATWVYWTVFDTAERDISDEWVWERLRNKRDTLLSISDFRMVTDAPWDIAPWIIYRQALRDLPKKTKNPKQAVWPEAPE